MRELPYWEHSCPVCNKYVFPEYDTYEANVMPREDICLVKHGLKIPVDAENYESFVSKMQVSESEFRQDTIG